jgi:hypothetical protein
LRRNPAIASARRHSPKSRRPGDAEERTVAPVNAQSGFLPAVQHVRQVLAGRRVPILNQHHVCDAMTLEERRRGEVLRKNHPAVIEHPCFGRPMALSASVVQKEDREGVGRKLQRL